MSTSEKQLEPIQDEDIIRSGRIDVGDGHELYWVDWGNKDVKNPIFYLHGGPGSGFNESNFDKFDPKKHRVVFHDQRGSGRSTPFASTENNTSQHLVEDINKIKSELGFEKISLYGFSWGSTLSLLYAIANPELVEKMLIGGIFLARRSDLEHFLHGSVATHFPEEFEQFTASVPDKDRKRIDDYYREMMASTDPVKRNEFARKWITYEASILKLDYDQKRVERNLKNFDFAASALFEAHYAVHDSFLEDNYILNNADKLNDIQTVIVHGRYDFICPPSGAYELSKKLKNAQLHMVMAGHSSSDTVQREVVKAYANMLWK